MPPNAKNPGSQFYVEAEAYWSAVPATLDGMLGGYASVNEPDIEASCQFLDEFGPSTRAYALDCGCGIGRITKQLLLPRFRLVDMVDVTQGFLNQALEYIGGEKFSQIGEQFCCGLQDFTPPSGRYDLIWIQWVLGHLGDTSLVAFLQRCSKALSQDGLIIVKENILPATPLNQQWVNDKGEDNSTVVLPEDSLVQPIFDASDSSFMRCRVALKRVFQEAGLSVAADRAQPNFPSSIYPVFMFALRPVKPESEWTDAV